MNKKYIARLVLLSFISFNVLTSAQAYGLSLWPFGKSDITGKDATFAAIYPASFWDSATWKVLKYAGTAAIAFGGAVLTGGLGILGGISVIGAVGSSVALTAVFDITASQIPSGTHRKTITLIKPRLFWNYVSPVVKSEMKELKNTLDDIAKKGETQERTKRAAELLEIIDSKLTEENKGNANEYTAYNYLFLAIIRYHMNKLGEAKTAVSWARDYIDPEKSSVLDYVDALLAFNDGDDKKAVNLLRGITEKEPQAATPYIVLAQSAFDNQNYFEAFDILDRGLRATDDEICVMSWMAGNSLYNVGRYKAAIPYYEKALKNMTINEYEALYKLNIAKCYKKLDNYKEAKYWLDDAISEVKDNKEMVEELKKQFFAD